jgi:hypothetical protein
LAARTVSSGLADFSLSTGDLGAAGGVRKRQAPRPMTARRQRANRVLRMGVMGFVRQVSAEFPDFRMQVTDLLA